MFVLIFSGEVIFLLPFVIPRIFRPTVLDVFDITNFELGAAFSAYGVVAIFSYFIGGPLADKFPARHLMTIALLSTAILGTIISGLPSYRTFVFIYGCWGATTILLFWAPLLRSVRIWGGESMQGRAYGLLDGGRGLIVALLASSSVYLLATLLPADVSNATITQKTSALIEIIWIFAAVTLLAGILTWLIIPESSEPAESSPNVRDTITFRGIQRLLKRREIWLQALVVVCAYVGYKATDDFSLFARDVYGYDDVAAARVSAISFWMRPLAAIAAGFLADRFRASAVVSIGFIVMCAGCLFVGTGFLDPNLGWMLVTTVVFTSIGIYAIRGVYFALLGEAHIPMAYTGTAIGLISVIGFLPDVFMGPVMGYLIDRSPGPTGHEQVFLIVAAFALIGYLASRAFTRTLNTES